MARRNSYHKNETLAFPPTVLVLKNDLCLNDTINNITQRGFIFLRHFWFVLQVPLPYHVWYSVGHKYLALRLFLKTKRSRMNRNGLLRKICYNEKIVLSYVYTSTSLKQNNNISLLKQSGPLIYIPDLVRLGPVCTVCSYLNCLNVDCFKFD